MSEDGKDEGWEFHTDGTLDHAEWDEVTAETPNGQNIEARLADHTRIHFRNGSFFRVTDSGYADGLKSVLIAQLPLVIRKPRCRTRESGSQATRIPVYESFRFVYVYDGSPGETGSADEIMKVISSGGRMSSTSRMQIYAFFVVMRSWVLRQREFVEYHEDIETDGLRIAVNSVLPEEKQVLQDLNELAKVITHPNAFAGLLSYLTVYPFSYELRQHGILTPIPLLEGKSHTGKSRLADLLITVGFNQPEGFKTVESVRTQHTLNMTLDDGRYPFVIDDIDMQFIGKFLGFMRSATSGTGESQRGNLTAKGITVRHARRLPVMTTNRIDELPEEMTNRFLQWRFGPVESNRVNKEKYFQIADRLPLNFMMIFIRRFNGWGLDGLCNELKEGHGTLDLKERYLKLGYSQIRKAYEENGIPCEIPEPKLVEEMTIEANDVFRSWLAAFHAASRRSEYDERARPSSWVERLQDDIEYEDEENWKVTVRAFREFLKEYRDCNYSARTFAEKYGYRYATVRIRGGPVVRGISSTSPKAGSIDEFKEN